MLCKMKYANGSVIYNRHIPSLHEYIKLCAIVLQNAQMFTIHKGYNGFQPRLCGVYLVDFGYSCDYDEKGIVNFDGGSYELDSYFTMSEE